MKFTSITKTNVEQVRSEINKKLSELKELGLNIDLGNIRYDNDSLTSKITCSIENAKDPCVKEFERSLVGRTNPHFLGKTIVFQGKEYKFTGMIPRARKNNARVERNGQTYRINFQSIVAQFYSNIDTGKIVDLV